MRYEVSVALGIGFALGVVMLSASDSNNHSPGIPRLEGLPAGATVVPALLFADVVKGEPYDQVGVKKCDFLLGFENDAGLSRDLRTIPDPDEFRRQLEEKARESGAYLRVLAQVRPAAPAGQSGAAYEIMQPLPRVLHNPVREGRPVAATVFSLVVAEIAPHSQAEILGLRKGDILYRVGPTEVLRKITSVRAADEMMRKVLSDHGGEVSIRVARCEPQPEGYLLRQSQPIVYQAAGGAGSP